jgi:hypothetical protein
MDFIPLCIVCGTTSKTKLVDKNPHACPVCKSGNSVAVVQSQERCCVCWIPLCKVGKGAPVATCSVCGSVMNPGSVMAEEARRGVPR